MGIRKPPARYAESEQLRSMAMELRKRGETQTQLADALDQIAFNYDENTDGWVVEAWQSGRCVIRIARCSNSDAARAVFTSEAKRMDRQGMEIVLRQGSRIIARSPDEWGTTPR